MGTPSTNLEPHLLLANGRGLRRLARRILKDAGRADDAVQDAWLVALEKQVPAASEGWLRGVVRNTSRNAARADRRRAAHEERAAASRAAQTPADLAEQMEEHRALVEALTSIPEPYRTTVWMRYFGGRSPASIAKHFEIPAATVRVRCKRGLVLLRQRLDARHEGDRGKWMAALVPLAGTGGIRTGVLWSVLMTAKAKTIAATVLVVALLAGGALVWSPGDDESNPNEDGAQLVGDADQRPELAPLEGVAPSDGDEARDDDSGAAEPPEEGDDGEHEPQNEPADGVRVKGRVLMKDGKPVPGVTVYLVPKDTSKRGRDYEPTRCETSAGGGWRFVAPHSHGAYWFVARPKGHEGLLTAFVDGANVRSDEPVVFRLEQSFERTFIVESFSGRDLVNPRIQLVPPDIAKIVTWPGPGEPTMGGWMKSLGGDRSWTLRPADDGPIRFTASAQGFATESVVLEAGDRRAEVRLALRESGVIRIRVKGFETESGSITGSLRYVDKTYLSAGQIATGYLKDGVIEFDTAIGPGTYRAQLTSAAIEDLVIESIEVAGYGQTVELDASVERKTNLGDMKIEIPAVEGKKRSWFVLLRKTDTGGSWSGMHWYPTPDLTWRFMGPGVYDFVVVHAPTDRCAVVRGVRVEAGKVARVVPSFGRVVLKRMHELETPSEEIARAEFVGPDGELLPVYRAKASQTFFDAVPKKGAELGPYPEGVRVLRLTLKNGKTKDVELEDVKK